MNVHNPIGKRPRVFCLMGPTACGKSATAMKLVVEFPIEIISVDSAMVYRGMDIGTAKPTAEDQARVPHHLLNIRDPKDTYSAGQFCEEATQAIESVLKRGRIPLLVGGTHLYFKALQEGLSQLPPAQASLREKLLEEAQRFGWPGMHQRLTKVDPQAAAVIHPHDQQRIQRALEIYEISGIPMSQYWKSSPLEGSYQFVNAVLLPEDREVLKEDIAHRFNLLLEQGFEAEVERLRARGDLTPDLPALKSVGYRQLWAYFDGESTREEMRSKAIFATRQLAKRQLTWLNHWTVEKQVFWTKSPQLISALCAWVEKNIV